MGKACKNEAKKQVKFEKNGLKIGNAFKNKAKSDKTGKNEAKNEFYRKIIGAAPFEHVDSIRWYQKNRMDKIRNPCTKR